MRIEGERTLQERRASERSGEMATASSRAGDAISIFRALLRVRREAFAGDKQALKLSAAQIRQEFEANRHVTDEATLSELLAQGREAVDFIALNVVQAKLNDRGNYGTSQCFCFSSPDSIE